MCDVFIVYPERRWVSWAKIAGWYADAVENGEAEPGAETPEEQAAALEDAGFITRAAPRRWEDPIGALYAD